MTLRQASLTLTLAAFIGGPGCGLRRQKAQSPPAPPPPVQQEAEPALIEPPHVSVAGSDVPQDQTPGSLESTPALPPKPKPAAPRPNPQQRRAARLSSTPPARIGEETANKPTSPRPADPKPADARASEARADDSLSSAGLQLQEALAPEKREELTQSYTRAMTESRQFLTRIGDRSLTQDQSESVARIRGFLKEAKDLHQTDIRTASQLAERALLLTRELVKVIE